MELIRVTDDTTVAELHECLRHLSRAPHTDAWRRRCDALLDEVLVRVDCE